MDVEILPSGHTADHSPLKKNQCDRKAASHPLPVLLNPPFKLRTRSPTTGGSEFLLGAGNLYSAYVRGLAYLAAHQGAEAAGQFQKSLDHCGIVISDPIGALAQLQLGRAYALSRDKTKAKSAYQGFLTLWKDADRDIPILKQAKAEYAKLQ
jgi:hypothetical protein